MEPQAAIRMMDTCKYFQVYAHWHFTETLKTKALQASESNILSTQSGSKLVCNILQGRWEEAVP